MPIARPGAKTKICSKCQKRKPLDQFGNHPAKRDGLHSHCKDCNRDAINALRRRTGYAYQRWYNKARNRAVQWLMEAHPDEFEALFAEELAATPAPQYERKTYERASA